MTSAQLQANRDAAAKLTRERLGLPADRTAWTYDQRAEYNRALASYMLQNPQLFDSTTLNTAEVVSKKNYGELEDTSFDLSMFATETVRPLSEAAQSVGSGVLSTLNLSKWLIPLAALAAVAILLMGLSRRVGASR